MFVCNLQQLAVILFSYQQLGSCLKLIKNRATKLPETNLLHQSPTLFQHIEVSSFLGGAGHCHTASLVTTSYSQVGLY